MNKKLSYFTCHGNYIPIKKENLDLARKMFNKDLIVIDRENSLSLEPTAKSLYCPLPQTSTKTSSSLVTSSSLLTIPKTTSETPFTLSIISVNNNIHNFEVNEDPKKINSIASKEQKEIADCTTRLEEDTDDLVEKYLQEEKEEIKKRTKLFDKDTTGNINKSLEEKKKIKKCSKLCDDKNINDIKKSLEEEEIKKCSEVFDKDINNIMMSHLQEVEEINQCTKLFDKDTDDIMKKYFEEEDIKKCIESFQEDENKKFIDQNLSTGNKIKGRKVQNLFKKHGRKVLLENDFNIYQGNVIPRASLRLLRPLAGRLFSWSPTKTYDDIPYNQCIPVQLNFIEQPDKQK